MYKCFFKRLIDIFISLLFLLIFFPVFIVIVICLCLVNTGKPFFVQARPGRNMEKFYIIKFKTMDDKRNSRGELLPDNLRVTKVGRFLRRTSIDELPQLINVLIGDMSLIGPRPLIFEYIPLYSVEQIRRHDVRPGITGLAQSKGRNALSWKKKFEYDVYYVDNLSFLLDIQIVLTSLKNVILQKDIDFIQDGNNHRFNGSN